MNAPPLTSKLSLGRRFAQAVRPYRVPLVLLLVYACSKLIFFQLARQQGLLQGVSIVSLGTLLFGVWLLVLRLVVLFYVPAVVVYRVALRLLGGPPTRSP